MKLLTVTERQQREEKRAAWRAAGQLVKVSENLRRMRQRASGGHLCYNKPPSAALIAHRAKTYHDYR